VIDLKAFASEGLDWIGRQAPGIEAELYVSRGEERGVELRDGRLDVVQESFSEGVGLRLLEGARMGFACAGGLGPDTVPRLFAQTKAQLAHLEEDSAKGFPAAARDGDDPALRASLWDEALFTASWGTVLPRLKEMEAAALGFDKRLGSVLRAGYSESRGEVVVANTSGLLGQERGGSCSVGLSTLCEEGGESQVGSAFQSSRKAAELDFLKVGRQAGKRTVTLLGARKLPSGRRCVIFDPWVAGELLELVASLLCADQVQRGKSLLAGKLGQKVGSELVTFVDDPRRASGLASSVYDDEGVPTHAKTMIEKGVIREYFYDHYTAAKEKRANNGCAGRGGFKGLPSPGSSNFFLAPGSQTREKIIADTRDGILVHDIMGMHMADPISGEFSVGVSGLAIEGGRLTHPVKNAMISGNLVELLGRVDAVGSDLTFYGSNGAPTFRVSEMTVA
jgi:PmbA protein